MNAKTRKTFDEEMPERRVCECGAIFETYTDAIECAACDADHAISAMEDKAQARRDGERC